MHCIDEVINCELYSADDTGTCETCILPFHYLNPDNTCRLDCLEHYYKDPNVM